MPIDERDPKRENVIEAGQRLFSAVKDAGDALATIPPRTLGAAIGPLNPWAAPRPVSREARRRGEAMQRERAQRGGRYR